MKKQFNPNPNVSVVGYSVSMTTSNQNDLKNNSFGSKGLHPLNESLMLRGNSMNRVTASGGLGLISLNSISNPLYRQVYLPR